MALNRAAVGRLLMIKQKESYYLTKVSVCVDVTLASERELVIGIFNCDKDNENNSLSQHFRNVTSWV